MIKAFKLLSALALALAFSVALSAPPKSELEYSIDFVQSYIESPDKHTQALLKHPGEHLTHLLKGMHGAEFPIYFRTDSAKIDQRGRRQIYSIAKPMLVYPMLRFRLEAHTDTRGSVAYNKQLSRQRIEAVKQEFKNALGRKYDPKRFYTGIYAAQFSAYGKNDEEGMSFDRRVNITLFIQSSNQSISDSISRIPENKDQRPLSEKRN